MIGRSPLARVACSIVLGLAVCLLAEPAAARTREFCDVLGSCCIPFGDCFPCEKPCGGHQQAACDSGAACDAGHRLVSSSFLQGLPTQVDCPSPIANEDLAGVCVRCGGHGEISCLGGVCDSGLVWTTTASLHGPIAQCKPSLPPDPPNFSVISSVSTSGITNTTVNPPPIETWLNSYNLCSNSAPDNFASSVSREPWPAGESPSGERGTVLIIHGRGGSCSGNRNELAASLYDRGHRIYCIEYAQGSYDPIDPSEPPTIRTVRALPLVTDESGHGAAGCAAGECTFARDRPVLSVEATSLTNTAAAAALAEIIETIPTVGRITLIAHSQGGYIARGLLHAHYDDLRWHGKEIERVVSLAHPYFAKEHDPQLYPPWACVKGNAGENYDCAVGRWLRGYDNWLGTSAYRIDDSDFPQIDWAATAGDGFNENDECDDDPVPPTCPPQQALEPAFTTLEESEACSFILGGVEHSSVAGDTSVPIQSSLGIDEHDFYPVESLQFDWRGETRCQHTGSCQLASPLAEDPLRLLGVPQLPVEVGSVDLDGVDDYLAVVGSNQDLEVTGALSLEVWVRPEREGQSEAILAKEGEYQLLLVNGELWWAIANTSPGWVSQLTGYYPPVHRWTHLAFVYDPTAGVATATTYANGQPIHTRAASGPIGDFVPTQDEFRLGSRQTSTVEYFDGRLDEVRVWNRALSRTEVVSAALGGFDPDDPNLLAWWNFDTFASGAYPSSNGSQVIALTEPSAATAPIRDAPVKPVGDAFTGGALQFDGQNDRAVLSNPAVLAPFESLSALTIEAWVHPRGPGGGAGGVIVNKEGEFALTRNTSGQIVYSLDNSVPNWASSPTGVALPARTWSHVAFSYDDAAPQAEAVKLYLNGALVFTGAGDGVIQDNHPAEDELQIGGRQLNDSAATANDQWFDGAIDEVRIWNRALPQAEVQAKLGSILDPSGETGLLGYWGFEELETGLAIGRSSTGAPVHLALGRNGEEEQPVRIPAAQLPGYPTSLLEDSDGDGLADVEETALGTDPSLADSDGDGLGDGFEARHGLDPTSAGDATGDPDGDGLDNLAELGAGTDPQVDDTDGDGVGDGAEVTTTSTDPLAADRFEPYLLATERDANLVLAIDVESGDRSIVSGGGVGAGTAIVDPLGIAREPGGTLLLTDIGSGNLLRIDPDTGDRALLGTAGQFGIPADLVVESAASAVVADQLFVPRVIRVNLATAQNTWFSFLFGWQPFGVAREASGTLVMSEIANQRIMRVDTVSSVLSEVTSNAIGSGPAMAQLAALALDPSGSILVVDAGSARLLRVDPTSGDRTTVSDAATGAGTAFVLPRGVVAISSSVALVGDPGTNKLFRVHLPTGDRTIVADGLIGIGPSLGYLEDLTWVPGLDQDGDGLTDRFELQYGTDPLAADAPGADRDGDGLTDLAEQEQGTSPISSDSDGDGVSDSVEVSSDTDPLLADTDGDGISDAAELNATQSDPTKAQPFAPRLIVTDATADALLEVDVATGERRTVSGAGVGSGAALTSLLGLAEEPGGAVLLVERSADLILRVDLRTGTRTIVSGGATGSGPALVDPIDLVVAADGSIFVSHAGTTGGILRVDALSGDRTLLASLPGAGDAYLALEASGALLATDAAVDGVRRIDPSTGALGTVSGTGVGSGPLISAPAGIAVAPDGAILVLDAALDALLRVDPVTGDRSVVSDAAQGLPAPATGACPGFCAPRGVAASGAGVALVGDAGSPTLDPREAILWVDTSSGHRTIASYRYRGGGPQVASPQDLLWFRGLDQDGDGLTDLAEVDTYGSAPLLVDTDGDGLDDGVEVNVHGTNPALADTDGDGYGDGVELGAGSDPLDPGSTPAPPAPIPALPPEAVGLLVGLLVALPVWLHRRRGRGSGRG